MLIVVYLAVVVAVLFVAAVVATSEDPVLADAPPDAADVALPVGPVQPEDVADLRFGMALRGYRMSEVDPVLARLGSELRARDQRIAELEGALVALAEPQVAALERAADPVSEPVPTPVPLEVAGPASAVGPPGDVVPASEVAPEPPAAAQPPADLSTEPPAAAQPPADLPVAPLAVAQPEPAQDVQPEPSASAPGPAATQAGAAPASVLDPEPAPAPAVTDLVAPDPSAVHVPVAAAPVDDDGFPEVLLPEAAAEGAVEAQEPDAPFFPEPVAQPPHAPAAHAVPAPDWGWPGEGAAPAVEETPGGERPPSP